ncbi:MAG: penicillin-binding protein [Clostridia bacterium]|nr:penicillin-binding protein [Clostridia bacterium]
MKKNYEKGKKSYSDVSKGKHYSQKKGLKQKLMDFALTKEYQQELHDKKANNLKNVNQDIKSDTDSVNLKIENSNAKTTSKPKSGVKKFFGTIVILILIFIVALCIFFIPYLSMAFNSYENGFDTTRIDIESVPHIYDKDGNLISIMYGYYDSGKENFVPTYSSVYTDLTSLPKFVGDAFTAIEDETFYDNSGISVNRLLYATFNYLVKGDSSFGGSTITQQLVKVSTGDDSHSPSRKAREIGSALHLTDKWSKDKILASYINLVYYGNGAYGIYEASITYFNTEPQNLNIAQAATLAAIPNSPESLNPYASESSKTRLMNRQKLVLKKMLELSLITEEEYAEAKNFNVEFTNGSQKIIKNNPAISPYLNIAFSEAIDIVMEHCNCDSSEAMDTILNGKTKIYLNMDTYMQNKAYELATSNYTDYPDFELGGVMTSKSGEVLAVISSRTNSQVDHAYSMTRQTGSAIKPISVYSPAYDLGIIEPNSYLNDSPVSIKSSSGTWNVSNADNRFRGRISVNDAIAYSLNTTAVITLEKVSLNKSLDYVKSFGITTVDENDLYYPALGLGGFTYGVSPYEMAQAYNVFNNDGVFRSISTINRIEINGETITKDKNEHQVISKAANDKMKTSLQCVAKYGTGRKASLSIKTTYLKTGTTNDVKDVWTCGFTDDVTTCIWGGYDIPKSVPFYNVNTVWKQLMEAYYIR